MSDVSLKASIKSHRDLIVWQKAMDLVVATYRACKSYPKDETYGLISQTRREAVSIPANIAEGQGRRSAKEFEQFLANARGSLLELDTHLELAVRLEYMNPARYSALHSQLDEVGRLLNGLMRSISTNI
jgi:four helix bundle protein